MLRDKLRWKGSNFRTLMRWFWLICILLVSFDITTTIFFSIAAVKENSRDTIERTESQISEYIRSVWNLGDAIAAAPATSDSTLYLRQRAQMLIPYADAYDLYMIGITDEKGLLGSTLERSQITSEKMLNDEGVGDLSSRPAFQEMMATGTSILTDTYLAGADGETMIYTIWIPYYSDEKIAGAVTISIKFAFIENIITSTSLQDNYYFTLMDSRNIISANPDHEMVDMTLEEAYGKSKWVSVPFDQLDANIMEGRSGSYWGINNNRLEYVTYMPVSGTPWKLVMRTDFFGSFQSTFFSLAIKLAAYLSLNLLFSLRKSREVIARERLFNMMTKNVDEVFLIYNLNLRKLDYVSSNSQRVLGLSAGAWTAKPDLAGPVFSQLFKSLDMNLEENTYYLDRELYNPQSGETHPYRIRVYRVEELSGRWAFMVITDETEEQEKNRALQEALTAAEKASMAKSEFLTNMSHDIRTPMNAIVGMSTIASSNLDDRDKVADCLRKVTLSSRHLLHLIGDVLDMSRIENGKVELNREPFDLCQSLRDLHEVFQPQAADRDISLLLELEEIHHCSVIGDGPKFNRILTKLLNNALKFTGADGTVRLAAKELPCDREGMGIYQISVSDNGIRIEPAFLDRLFEPFERVESSTISKTEGSGLGLAIVKRLAELMGGTVQVVSREAAGSCFTVRLPFEWNQVQSETPLPCECSRQSEQELRQRRILLVEDNEINMEIAKELLEMAERVPDGAWNGVEALKKFKNSPLFYYDMIITDIQMPQMDGYETAKAIRSLQRSDAATIPIIAMTADASPEARKHALEMGMNGYITKPVELEQLMKVIKMSS